MILIVKITKGTNNYRGTWGHPQIAINCGQWCSPQFAVLVSKWVFDWIATAKNPVEHSSTLLSSLNDVAKAYIESSQSLNRVIHTAVHQQTDSLRKALEALETSNNLTIVETKISGEADIDYVVPHPATNSLKDSDRQFVIDTPVINGLTVENQLDNLIDEAVLTVNDSGISTESVEVVEHSQNSIATNTRRSRGEGTGRIQWRTITKKNGKQYQQAWYDWQLHIGNKAVSKSTYIPKHLLNDIQELEAKKATVIEILSILNLEI